MFKNFIVFYSEVLSVFQGGSQISLLKFVLSLFLIAHVFIPFLSKIRFYFVSLLVISVNVKWHRRVTGFHDLMVNDGRHLFVSLLAVQVYFLVKCQFGSFFIGSLWLCTDVSAVLECEGACVLRCMYGTLGSRFPPTLRQSLLLLLCCGVAQELPESSPVQPYHLIIAALGLDITSLKKLGQGVYWSTMEGIEEFDANIYKFGGRLRMGGV